MEEIQFELRIGKVQIRGKDRGNSGANDGTKGDASSRSRRQNREDKLAPKQ